MIHLRGFDIKDVTPFKDVSVDLNSGVTYITGVNLDSDKSRPTTNGAGKTRLFSVLPVLFYQSTPLGVRKNDKANVLRKKTSQIIVEIQASTDGPVYEISQKANKVVIHKDGEDQQVRTLPLANEYIRNHVFPLSDTEFYLTVYLTTQKNHLLQNATDSNRLQTLIDLFHVDQYSALHKYFSTKASTIQDSVVKLSVLEERRQELRRRLKKVKTSDSGEDLAKKAKDKLSKLTQQERTLQSEKFSLVKQLEKLEALLRVEERLDKLRSRYQYKTSVADTIAWLKGQRKSERAWSAYESEKKAYSAGVKSLVSKLDYLPEVEETTEVLKKKLSKASASLEALQEQYSTHQENQQRSEELETKIKRLAKQIADVEFPTHDLSEDIATCKSTLKLKSLVDHEHDAEPGKCPTCLSDVDFAAVKGLVKKAEKKLVILLEHQRLQEIAAKLVQLKKELKQVDYDPSVVADLENQIKQVKSTVTALEDQLDILKKRQSLQEQLDSIEKPERPTLDKNKLCAADIEAEYELCSEIQAQLEAKAALLKSEDSLSSLKKASAVRTVISSLKTELSEVTGKMSSLAESISECSSILDEYNQSHSAKGIYEKELASVESKIEALRPAVEEKKLVTLLVKAYGAKGLRTRAIQGVCKLLEQNLNCYRDLVFSEPFIFTVDSTDTGVSILVDRNNGKDDSVSDVRELSGAESNSFRLLCLLALLPLIPDSRRTNFVVLDELTSHMHKSGKELFCERFIPTLRELIPHVFVITNDEERTPNSAEWCVVKNKGVSKLETYAEN